MEIVKAAAQGSSIKKTAADLKISTKTVQAHRRSIIEKMACGNLTNAVYQLTQGGKI